MIDLAWEVPVEGFEWLDTLAWDNARPKAPPVYGRWLARVTDQKPRTYNTKEFPALFRTFAELKSTEEAIAEFAETYGLLTRGFRHFPRVDAEQNVQSVDCESQDLWALEIRDMQHVLRWQEKVRFGDSRWLNDFLKYKPDGDELVHEFPDSKGFGEVEIASKSKNTEVLEAFKAGRFVDAARETLLVLLNTKIANHPIYIQLRARRGVRPEPAQLIESLARPWCDQSVVPEDLLGALWMQAVLAVQGVKGYRQCEQCGKWFELTEERRGDAKFCSPACRSRAYRARIAQRVDEETKSKGKNHYRRADKSSDGSVTDRSADRAKKKLRESE